MQLILLLLILVFCFALRAYPRVRLKYGIASDSFFHLKHAADIRADHMQVFYELKNSVIKIVYSYPYLYHWLLALFSERTRPWAERFTGAFFDTLNVLIIYVFTRWYLIEHHLNYPFLNLAVCFLYAVSPALLRFNGGPRSFNGSPRIMAQTLYLIHIFSFYHYSVTGNFISLLLSICFAGWIAVGSTFGTQVLLFFAVIFSLLFSWKYLLILVASILFILVFSGGKVVRVLKGHFGHARFLAERIGQQSPYQSRTPVYINNMKEVAKSLMQLKFKRAVPFFHDENYPLHNFLFYYPSFFILLNIGYFDTHKFLYISVLAAVALYIFTSFKRFKFLGEPVRYLDYVLVPSYILSYIFLSEHHLAWIFYLFIGYSLLSMVYFLQQFYKLYFNINDDYPALQKCFSELDKMEKGNLFAFNSNGHLSYFFTKQPIVNALIGNLDVNLFSKEDSDLVIGNYPLPGKDLDAIIKRFDVKYIVMNKNELNTYTTRVLTDASVFYERTKLLFETKTAMFFKVI